MVASQLLSIVEPVYRDEANPHGGGGRYIPTPAIFTNGFDEYK